MLIFYNIAFLNKFSKLNTLYVLLVLNYLKHVFERGGKVSFVVSVVIMFQKNNYECFSLLTIKHDTLLEKQVCPAF